MATGFVDRAESISRFCDFTAESSRILSPIQGFEKLPLVSLQEAVQPLASLVSQINQMVWTIEENYDQPKDGLSKDETTSIMLYTLEWAPSTDSFYCILNAVLRSEDRNQLTPWFSYLRLFIHAISKLSWNSHHVIYRGIHMDLSDDYPEGKEFIWWSFTSCTSLLNIVKKFIGRDGKRTIFNIVCYSAKDISRHSCHEKEQEILCYPARKFKVKSCFNAGNQLHIIHLEEIQSKFPFFPIPLISDFPVVELEQTHIDQILTDNNSVQRRAIGSSGHLGCLYDINRDRVGARLNANDMKRSSQLCQTMQCQMIHGGINTDESLLKIIGVQEELRLSLLLNLAARTGLALLDDYTRPIDKYSRLIHYLYVEREERLPNEISKIQKCILPGTDATHIITGMTLGIEFVVVLQLPANDQLAQKIDHVLNCVQAIFQGNREMSSLTSDDENVLNTIIDTKIYSNISKLVEMTSLLDVWRCKGVVKKKESMFRPLTYTLRQVNSQVIFTVRPSNLNNKVERHLIHLSTRIRQLKQMFDQYMIPLLSGHLQRQQQEVQNLWGSLKEVYANEMERFRNVILSIRTQQNAISKIDQTLNSSNQTMLHDRMRQLMQRIENLAAKKRLIADLQEQQFRYYDVNECHISEDENEQSLELKLIKDNRRDRFLCSNDTLNSNHQSQLNQLRHQLIRERQSNPHLNLIYADFSDTSFDLHNMMILPSDKLINSAATSQQRRPFSMTQSETSLQSLPVCDEFINILLLGETKVDTSAFINALANYLIFETFEQAESNAVLSDIGHPDQSSPQHCISYVFHLHHHDGKKLRIIDTRDLNEDHLHLEPVLQYIHHFSHLNAICLLFKSNVTERNISFGNCLIELFAFLDPTVHRNLIFCFTEGRLNSFNLENTIQLLEKTFNSLSMNDIPLSKENIFCFDEKDRQRYQTSWSMSTIELNRLIDYIHQNLIPCRRYQSTKQVSFEIIPMIRPILETMRNILRNMIVQKMNLTKQFIQLNPKAIHRAAMMCLLCKPHVDQVGHFWIVTDVPHEIQETCYTCSCSPKHHIPIDYILEYELSNDALNSTPYQMEDMLTKLCCASAEFAFFLMYVSRSANEDPFSLHLIRMINEEENLCLCQQSNQCNIQLVNDLNKIKNDYETQLIDMKKNHRYSSIPDIYKWIQTVRQSSVVHEQMIAIKQGQDIRMKQYDYEVPDHLTDASINKTMRF